VRFRGIGGGGGLAGRMRRSGAATRHYVASTPTVAAVIQLG
jgi:hypothetical protein